MIYFENDRLNISIYVYIIFFRLKLYISYKNALKNQIRVKQCLMFLLLAIYALSIIVFKSLKNLHIELVL